MPNIRAFTTIVKDDDKLRITKLKGPSNWYEWKSGIKDILMDKELDEYVLEDTPREIVDAKNFLSEAATTSSGVSTRKATDEEAKAEVERKLLINMVADWQKKSKRGLAILRLYMELGQRPLVEQCIDGREAYLKLTSIYDNRDEASKLAKEMDLMSIRMKHDESVANFISRVEAEAANCRDVGLEISDQRLVNIILMGLTDAFNVKRTMILHDASKTSKPLTVTDVTRQLIADETSQRVITSTTVLYAKTPSHKNNTRETRKYNNTSERNPAERKCSSCGKMGCKCGWCQKPGHHTIDCYSKKNGKPRVRSDTDSNEYNRTNRRPDYKSQKESRENKDYKDNNESKDSKEKEKSSAKDDKDSKKTVFMAAFNTGENRSTTSSWLLDSGCTDHVFKDKQYFVDFNYHRTNITTGDNNNHTFFTEGKGTVEFQVVTLGTLRTIRLHDAYYAPNSAETLISENTLVERGAHIAVSKGHRDIIVDGEVVIRATMHNRLNKISVIVKASDDESDLAMYYARQENKAQDIKLWHRRLGHVGHNTLLQTLNAVEGMKVESTEIITDCIACHTGKVPREPFTDSSTIVTIPLQVISVDLAGPMQVPTPEGGLYFLIVIDKCTQYKNVYILARKNDAMINLKQYIAKAENLTNYKVKIVRSDNDSVLCNSDAEQWFKDKGISHERTVVYTPQQNGSAERAVRSIKEIANALLEDAKTLMEASLDKRLWGEACKTAAYLDNRTYKNSIRTTPYEAMFDHKPKVGHLKVFGCRAFVFVDKSVRPETFGPHKIEKVFVGYPEDVKGWRFFDEQTGKFCNAESVLFLENEAIPIHKVPVNTIQELDDNTINDLPLQLEGEISDNDASSTGIIEERDENSLALVPNNTSNRVPRAPVVPSRILPSRTHRPRSEWEGNLFMRLAEIRQTEYPLTYREAIGRADAHRWLEAMESEISSIQENETYELTRLPPGRKPIGSRWVYTIKPAINSQPERYKARLVAKGFTQIEGIDFEETFAPVAKAVSIRAFFSIIANRDYEMTQIDVVTAFLYGKLDEEIYVRQPEGFIDENRPDAVWRLNKALYGLKQSPRVWFETLKSSLIDLGFILVDAEACIFRNNDATIFIIVYVDDMIVAASDTSIIEAFISALGENFKLKVIGEVQKFLGFEVTRNRQARTILLKQETYAIDILDRLGMSESSGLRTPMEMGLKLVPGENIIDLEMYRKAIGCLMYLYVMTRPDIGYSLSLLASFMARPSQEHWNAVKRLLRYVQNTKAFGLTVGGKELNIFGFTDASFADRHGARSTGGYVFYLGDGPISWSSKGQSLVALSSTESEYIQATESAKEAIWLSKLLKDFEIITGTIPLYGDNRSSLALAINNEFHSRTKHRCQNAFYPRGYKER